MTRDELRNAINNTCDIMRREGLTTKGYAVRIWQAVDQTLPGQKA